MESLTTRQQQILDFIRNEIARSGYPPTRAEICTEFGFRSPNAAEAHLRALERKGAIRMTPNASRAIQLADEAANEPGLPLVGRVAAGSPILAVENIERHVPVEHGLFAEPADYLLTVHGMSMRDAGILDGDLIAVRKAETARDRQIVVARLEDEVTVKRLELDRSRQRVRLLPENPDFTPIEVDAGADNFAIEGIVVGLVRAAI